MTDRPRARTPRPEIDPSRSVPGSGCARRVAVGAWLVAATITATLATAAERDWGRVELAWRGDPRAVADAPLGGEVPQARRPSRRAQRRSLRRGQPQPGVARAAPAVQSIRPAGRDAAPPPIDGGLPRPTEAACLVHQDQPYTVASTAHPRHRLDIHLPADCSGGKLPLVVWIPGADWRTGTKAECPVTWLVARGYVVASVSYRTTEHAAFPAQLDDCRAAIATLVADAETWGIDTTRICVAGSAAGGHLAALVGLDAPSQRGGGAPEAAETAPLRADVAAVCTFGAPTLLTALGPEHDRAGSAASRLVGGPLPEFREAAQRASPTTHVSADDPPALVVHAGRDPLVPVEQAIEFDRVLKAAGVEATLVILDRATTAVPAEGTAAGAAFVEFLDRVLGPGGKPDPSAALQ